MPLNDNQLIEWAKTGGVDPFVTKAVNPASIDLHLGSMYFDYKDKRRIIHKLNNIKLYPNDIKTQLYNAIFRNKRLTIILAMTLEYISIPEDMAGMIKLKTTPTRKGLGQIIGDWVDPGFCGNLTLMLYAHSPINLRFAQPICQLVLEKLDYKVSVPYGDIGHYQGISIPTFAYDEVKS